jgi:small-conductance mechanosensitive channel
MRLFEVFARENIEFAFPTQTIYLEKNDKTTASQTL